MKYISVIPLFYIFTDMRELILIVKRLLSNIVVCNVLGILTLFVKLLGNIAKQNDYLISYKSPQKTEESCDQLQSAKS